MSSKVYRIGHDSSWSTLRAMGKQNNLLAFSDDLLYYIAVEEKIRIELVSAQENNLFNNLDDHVFDAIISPFFPTQLAKEDYVFSDPFFLVGPVLVVQASSGIKSIAEMENKMIGIQSGSSVVFNIDKYPNINITPYENVLAALESLSRGHIDGVIIDVIPAYMYVSSLYKGILDIATDPLTREGLRVIARQEPDGELLISRFNEGLKAAKKSGTYDTLLKKWGLFNPDRVSIDQ